MGQCSTLPAEGRGHQDHQPGGRYMPNSTQFDDGSHQPDKVTTTRGRQYNNRRGDSNVLQVTVPRNEGKESRRRSAAAGSQTPSTSSQQQYQSRQSSQSIVQPMQEDPPREAPPLQVDNAKRARCYQLNLESDFVGMTGDVRVEGSLLGPYEQPPPPLTYSASDDSSQSTPDPTAIAIRTAQIFRGITISNDGTILSQNARATRSNRGNKNKRGEKSRQATKIQKANDLVEETFQTGKAPGSKEPANLVSLYIMGEYDEMKYLVRDGSKKLREASALPDDALLSINRSRTTSFLGSGLISPTSRKRISPSSNMNRHAPPPNMPQSAPPKLKSHPRDLPSSRRDDNRRARAGFLPDNSCFAGPSHGDSDWIGISHGFNSIWNCGQNQESGTASPIQVVGGNNKEYGHRQAQPSSPQPRVYEGRNESSYNGRHDPANISMRA